MEFVALLVVIAVAEVLSLEHIAKVIGFDSSASNLNDTMCWHVDFHKQLRKL